VRALVTGARGFVGTHLCTHLREEGDEVVACDRRGDDGFDVVDAEATRAALARHRPDVVYHLAAFAHVGASWEAPGACLRVNAEGTANVLAAARACGVARVLVVGSAEEYGAVAPSDLPLTEDTPLRPTTPYGASKVAASFVALQAQLAGGVETVRVRAFGHTGPGQSDRYLVPALARRIAAAERDGHDEVPVGSLEPVRDLTDVRDVVRAYRALVLRGVPGEVYNVCSGRGVSVREIADRLVARARRPLRLVADPALVRTVDVPRLVGDPTRLQAATGWSPSRPLDETLGDVLAEARQGP
jgi:GDP-4-dehydro-6-deoxy-D-mannose reductase